MRAAARAVAGGLAARLLPQCRFENALFLLGHMRCGSTALSAILCSRPDISGYGEAHIAYRARAALGRLAVNQSRRAAFDRKAPTLFDKILHQRYDAAACDGFFAARALFMAREPAPAILSIRKLFDSIGSGEYASDAAAADYYAERLEGILALWPRFAAGRRVAVTYEALTAAPEIELARISDRLGFDPPLENLYRVAAAATGRGAGDPLFAGKYDRIVATTGQRANDQPALDIPAGRLAELSAIYRRFAALCDQGSAQAPLRRTADES